MTEIKIIINFLAVCRYCRKITNYILIVKKNGKTIRAKALVSIHFHDEESKRRINQEIRELRKLLERQNKHG